MDMLRAVKEGAEGPTRIMYGANLSWDVLREHLSSLVQNELLAEQQDGKRKKYDLTEKGAEILEAYCNVLGVIPEATDLLAHME
jgi:predicted transcriptional regulator